MKNKKEIPERLKALARVNPHLYRNADRAATAEEFIGRILKADKTTRDKVHVPTLVSFFNKVKGINEPAEAPDNSRGDI